MDRIKFKYYFSNLDKYRYSKYGIESLFPIIKCIKSEKIPLNNHFYPVNRTIICTNNLNEVFIKFYEKVLYFILSFYLRLRFMLSINYLLILFKFYHHENVF